jgi:hypothetical protein
MPEVASGIPRLFLPFHRAMLQEGGDDVAFLGDLALTSNTADNPIVLD